MKRLYSTLFLVFIFFGCSGQTNVYHPFPDSDAVWRVNWYVNYYNTNNDYCSGLDANYDYSIGGDTTINAMTYKKIIRSGFTFFTNCDNFLYGYVGGLRQDTLQKKVFFRPWNINIDTLIYDFSLNVGDTLKSYLLYWHTSPPITIYSIDSVLVGNQYRKRWNLCTPNCAQIIEGVGSNYGLLEQLVNFESGGDLTCFLINNNKLYPDTTSPCVPLGINEIKNPFLFTASPNPSSGIFTITSSEKINSIEIFDVLGNKIENLKIKNEPTEINISKKAKGIYFVKIVDEKGNFSVKKIIVE